MLLINQPCLSPGADKNNRLLEEQINELTSRTIELEQNLHDCENNRSKSSSENASLSKQLEDAEHKLGLSKKENKNLESTLQEARQVAEEESKVNKFYSFFLRYFVAKLFKL